MREAARDEAALTDSGWPTNPLEARIEGGTAAETTISTDTIVLYDFDLSAIPTVMTVTGIVVRVDAKKTDSGGTSLLRIGVELSWNSGTSWTTLRTTDLLTATQATYTLGDPDDDWGRTWTRAELTGSSTFRLRLTASSDSISGTPTWHVYFARPTVYFDQTFSGERVKEIIDITERIVTNPTVVRVYEKIDIFDAGSGGGSSKIRPRRAQQLRLAGTALSSLESSSDYSASTRPQHREGLGCRITSEDVGLDLFIGDATLLTRSADLAYPALIMQPGFLDLVEASREAEIGGTVAQPACEIRLMNRDYVNQYIGASTTPRSLSWFSNLRPVVGGSLTIWSFVESGDGWKKLVIFNGIIEDMEFEESSVTIRAVELGSGTIQVPDVFVDEHLFNYEPGSSGEMTGEQIEGNRGKPVPIGLGRFDYGAVKLPTEYSATHPFRISFDTKSGDEKTYTNIALFPAMMGLKHPMMPTIQVATRWRTSDAMWSFWNKYINPVCNVFLFGSRKSSPTLGVFTGPSHDQYRLFSYKKAQTFPGFDTDITLGGYNEAEYALFWTWNTGEQLSVGLPFIKAISEFWGKKNGYSRWGFFSDMVSAGFMEWLSGSVRRWTDGTADSCFGVWVDSEWEPHDRSDPAPEVWPGAMQAVAIPMAGQSKIGRRTRVTNIIPIFRTPEFTTTAGVTDPQACMDFKNPESASRVDNMDYLSLQCPIDGPQLGKIKAIRICMLWDAASTAENVYLFARLGPSQNYAIFQAVYGGAGDGTDGYNRDYGAVLNETDISDPDSGYFVPTMKLSDVQGDTPYASFWLLPYWDPTTFNTDPSSPVPYQPPFRVPRYPSANVLFDSTRKTANIGGTQRDLYTWRRGRSEWDFTSMDTSDDGAFDYLEWPWDFMIHVRDLSGGVPIANRWIDVLSVWMEVIFESPLKKRQANALVTQREFIHQSGRVFAPAPGSRYGWELKKREIDFPAVNFRFQKASARESSLSPIYVTGRGAIDDGSGSITGTAYRLIENPADVAQALIRHYGGDAVFAARATGSDFGSFSTARTILGPTTYRMTLVVDKAETLDSVMQRIAAQSMATIVESIDLQGYHSWRMFVETDDPATDDPNRMYRTDGFGFSLDHMAEGTLRVSITPIQEMASNVTLAYGLHLPTGEWSNEKYVGPESSNFDNGAAAYMDAMSVTARDYRITSRLRIEAPDIWDPDVAERLCKWHANRVRRKRVTVEFETYANGMDCQPGHVITFSDDMQTKVYYPGDALSWGVSQFNVTQVVGRKDAGQMARVLIRATEIITEPS